MPYKGRTFWIFYQPDKVSPSANCHSHYSLPDVPESPPESPSALLITSDNPRNEEPQEIIDDIKVGISKTKGNYVEIIDRKEAIAYAIHHGEPGDIVVLAGKGHEDYQEIKGKKYPMDERILIQEILEEDKKNG